MVKIQIGGAEHTLYFGKMGFLKHLGNLLQADPLDIFGEAFTTDPLKTYKINKAIIHAGLLTECDVANTTANFTTEDVDKWVSVLDTSELKELIIEAFAAISGKTVEELKKVMTQATESSPANA